MTRGAQRQLVSVVVPAYNASAYIADAINSVVAQTYEHWELVVVDDGSTDDTEAVVKGLELPPARLTYLRTENAGPGPARNRAIERLRGDLIAFLDTDDEWYPQKLTLQVGAMLDGGHGVVYSNGHYIGDAERHRFDILAGAYSACAMFRLLFLYNRLPLSSVLASTRAVVAAGAFKESGLLARQGEDYDLWLRMAAAGSSFLGMPEQLVGVRVLPGSHVHRPRRVLEGDLQVVLPFAAQMERADPEAYRQRMASLHNRLTAARAGDGDLGGARRGLADLRAFEARRRVRAKEALLLVLRRRYAALYWRLLRRGGAGAAPVLPWGSVP